MPSKHYLSQGLIWGHRWTPNLSTKRKKGRERWSNMFTKLGVSHEISLKKKSSSLSTK